MLAADLVVGRAYAQRGKPHDAGSALRKIIFVGPAKAGKAKIRHADGDLDGLEEWVPTRTVMCPWGERQESPAPEPDSSGWYPVILPLRHELPLPGSISGSSGHKMTARPAAARIAAPSSSAWVSATPYSGQVATNVTGPSGGKGYTQKSPSHRRALPPLPPCCKTRCSGSASSSGHQ